MRPAGRSDRLRSSSLLEQPRVQAAARHLGVFAQDVLRCDVLPFSLHRRLFAPGHALGHLTVVVKIGGCLTGGYARLRRREVTLGCRDPSKGNHFQTSRSAG